MRYFAKILAEHKKFVKMNNQTDSSFDLIFLNETSYNQIMNRVRYSLKRDIEVNLAWEFVKRRNSFKIYRNIKMGEIKDNFNPFKKKIEGKVISFTCDSIDYYTDDRFKIGTFVPKTDKKWKDTKILSRALKLSNINFEIKEL